VGKEERLLVIVGIPVVLAGILILLTNDSHGLNTSLLDDLHLHGKNCPSSFPLATLLLVGILLIIVCNIFVWSFREQPRKGTHLARQ